MGIDMGRAFADYIVTMKAEVEGRIPAIRHDAITTDVGEKICVDTCDSVDEGWETAITLDRDNEDIRWFIVQRYDDKKQAAKEHLDWVQRATDGINRKRLNQLQNKLLE